MRPAIRVLRWRWRSVVLDGRILTDTDQGVWRSPAGDSTSLVTQQPSLFPHLSVKANVAYGLGRLDRANPRHAR